MDTGDYATATNMGVDTDTDHRQMDAWPKSTSTSSLFNLLGNHRVHKLQ